MSYSENLTFQYLRDREEGTLAWEGLEKAIMAFNLNKLIVARQRAFFRTGEPAKLDFRKEQLRTLRNFIKENREALCDAVYQDLKRSQQTTYIVEISNTVQEIDYMLANLSEWSKPTMVR